jgi:hypothetical protein
MHVEKGRLGITLITSWLALALVSFFFIDRYDDKKGFLSNVMEARYTIWKDCKKPDDKRMGGFSSWEDIQKGLQIKCDYVQLPYRWILVAASGLFLFGLFVKASKAK